MPIRSPTGHRATRDVAPLPPTHLRGARRCVAGAAATAGAVIAAVVGLALAGVARAERPALAPAFELRALGVLGGDDESNLSSYLLARPGEPAAVMLDGGSPLHGIARWKERDGVLTAAASPGARARAVADVLRHVRALLLTHSHLDHLAGFALGNPLEVDLALAGRPPVEVVALPATIEALRGSLYRPPLWADFTAVPAARPVVRLAPLAPGRTRAVGAFEVSAIPLDHSVPSAAFLVRSGDAAYLHLGDTGPTEAVWAAARPLVASRTLRAVAVEVSFPSAKEALATATGHLTPRTLVRELEKLAGIAAPAPAAATATAAAVAADLAVRATAVAARLGPCAIVAIHIKGLDYDAVVAELAPLRRAGLRIVIPEQGERYLF